MSYVLQANAEPSKILYIDSRDATNYLATSLGGFSLTSYFQYQLIEKIEVPTNQRALISLNSATIPYSFYNIRENINNKLKCRATNTDSGAFVESTLNLPSANYDAYSFAQTLETFFKTDLQQPVDNITYNIVIDYSTDLQKYNYVFTKFNDAVVSPNMRVDLFFDDTTITQTPHIEMGFREGEARVAMLPDLRTIDTLTIRLTDERNRILDLNGLHFQIAIAIDFVYAKRKINIPMGSLRLNDHGDSHVDDHEILDRAKSKIKNSSIKK